MDVIRLSGDPRDLMRTQERLNLRHVPGGVPEFHGPAQALRQSREESLKTAVIAPQVGRKLQKDRAKTSASGQRRETAYHEAYRFERFGLETAEMSDLTMRFRCEEKAFRRVRQPSANQLLGRHSIRGAVQFHGTVPA